MNKLISIAALLSLTLALSACGKKGDLETPGADDAQEEAALSIVLDRDHA